MIENLKLAVRQLKAQSDAMRAQSEAEKLARLAAEAQIKSMDSALTDARFHLRGKRTDNLALRRKLQALEEELISGGAPSIAGMASDLTRHTSPTPGGKRDKPGGLAASPPHKHVPVAQSPDRGLQDVDPSRQSQILGLEDVEAMAQSPNPGSDDDATVGEPSPPRVKTEELSSFFDPAFGSQKPSPTHSLQLCPRG